MARTKSTRSTTKTATPKARASKSSQTSNRSSDSSSDESFSFSNARGYVEDKVSLQTAGLALAGAGILALVSSAAGRSLIRTAATSVARLATENFGEYFGASEEESDSSTQQRPSRHRNQDRV